MRWVIAILVIVLFTALGALFTAAAIAIRRDYKARFKRIDARFQADAEAILRNLPYDVPGPDRR
jgi:hypothetical protein